MTNAVTDALRRTNTYRDTGAAALIVLGLLMPWNIYFGITISGTTGWVLGLVVLATLLSLAGLILTHAGPVSMRVAGDDLQALDRLRLMFSIPYLVVVTGFIVFAVVQAIRTGTGTTVSPGIGPGLWFGLAGALLAAQPVLTHSNADDVSRGAKASRIIAVVSLVLAVIAVLFNLYLRTRFVVPNIGDPETGTQNLMVAVVAVLYGIVALLPVLIAARWLISAELSARLATVLLAVSTMAAGLFVWVLPVGRQLDSFHGIAQNTSAAGVGFEGYLAWIAAAAIGGTVTVLASRAADGAEAWLAAARKFLVLIAVWCAGSAALRIGDVLLASVLDKPDPPYISTTLMVFDLVVALLAGWLFINGSGRSVSRRLLTVLYGILFAFTVCRVILGVALVPRVQPLDPQDINAVYGNTLAQQITSTFDVVLCVVALALVTIAFLSGGGIEKPAARPTKVEAKADEAAPTTVIPAPTAKIAAPTAKIAAPTAKIASAETDETPDAVADVLAQSTQRFAAGTTYGGSTGGDDAGNTGQ